MSRRRVKNPNAGTTALAAIASGLVGTAIAYGGAWFFDQPNTPGVGIIGDTLIVAAVGNVAIGLTTYAITKSIGAAIAAPIGATSALLGAAAIAKAAQPSDGATTNAPARSTVESAGIVGVALSIGSAAGAAIGGAV